MRVILRPGMHGNRAHPITDEELDKGLEDGTIVQINDKLYREATEQEYKTRDMKPTRKRGRPKKSKAETEADTDTDTE